MDQEQRQKIAQTVLFVVQKLSENKFRDLEAMTNGSRLSANEMRTAISEYGIDILVPSELAYKEIDIYGSAITETKSWRVDYDLHDKKTGLSDLTLQVELAASKSSLMAFRIEDIRVL